MNPLRIGTIITIVILLITIMVWVGFDNITRELALPKTTASSVPLQDRICPPPEPVVPARFKIVSSQHTGTSHLPWIVVIEDSDTGKQYLVVAGQSKISVTPL